MVECVPEKVSLYVRLRIGSFCAVRRWESGSRGKQQPAWPLAIVHAQLELHEALSWPYSAVFVSCSQPRHSDVVYRVLRVPN